LIFVNSLSVAAVWQSHIKGRTNSTWYSNKSKQSYT